MIILERGRNIEHIREYVNVIKVPWKFPYRGDLTRQITKDYRVSNPNETNFDWWTNEKECPYVEKTI